MSIQSIGFLDVSNVVATFVAKYKKSLVDGVLMMRDLDENGDAVNLGILKEWNSGRAILSKLRAGAAPFFQGQAPTLGRAWIEHLPPGTGTPWLAEDGEYAEAHARTRTCLVPSPGAFSHSGASSAVLNVGIVNLVDHRQLCAEVNHSPEFARTCLVVDVRRPDA